MENQTRPASGFMFCVGTSTQNIQRHWRLPRNLTTQMVSELTGCSQATVRRWIKSGLLPAIWSEGCNQWLVRRQHWREALRPIMAAHYREMQKVRGNLE